MVVVGNKVSDGAQMRMQGGRWGKVVMVMVSKGKRVGVCTGVMKGGWKEEWQWHGHDGAIVIIAAMSCCVTQRQLSRECPNQRGSNWDDEKKTRSR